MADQTSASSTEPAATTDSASAPASSSNNAGSSGSIGAGLGDVSSLVDLVIKVVDQSIAWSKEGSIKREEKRKENKVLQELKDGLGEWVTEAQDDESRWQEPFLGSKMFDKYITESNGVLKPVGKSTASFGWAQLLFALNIRPRVDQEDGIISWKLNREAKPAKSGNLSLRVNGEVLCHIINLYQLYESGPTTPGEYRFSFGDLKEINPMTHLYEFSGISHADLVSTKLPLTYSMHDLRGQRNGHVDTGFWNHQYWNAINNDISNLEAQLVKSKPGENARPLQERADSLVKAMEIINNLKWEDPLIISPEWAADASRIKRRVTNGRKETLASHVIECLSQKPAVKQDLQDCLSRPDQWKDEARLSVKAACLSEHESFEFVWKDPNQFLSEPIPTFNSKLREELPWILRSFVAGATSTSEAISSDTLLRVLEMPNKIINKPVVVLREIPKKWNFVAEIKG